METEGETVTVIGVCDSSWRIWTLDITADIRRHMDRQLMGVINVLQIF